MSIVVYTNAELAAYDLIYGRGMLTTNGDVRARTDDACNQIIELAERIKSSRASATLQNSAQDIYR